MDKVKIIFWIIGGGVILYILLIGFLLFAPKLKSYSEQTAFDSTKWRMHLTDQNSVKQTMVNDLFLRYQLIGMNKANIDELLGVPPSTNKFKQYDYVYWLGPERSAIAVDSEWLVINFESDIVVKAAILTD